MRGRKDLPLKVFERERERARKRERERERESERAGEREKGPAPEGVSFRPSSKPAT